MGETINKIASIFAQAAADAAFDEIQLSESDKVDKAIKTVKGALDKAHTGSMAYITAKPLHDILKNYCREEAISLLQRFIKKYEKFINITTPITGKKVVYIENPYDDKTDEYIQTDIKFIVLIIYFAAITEESTKMLVEKAFKDIFGIFKK